MKLNDQGKAVGTAAANVHLGIWRSALRKCWFRMDSLEEKAGIFRVTQCALKPENNKADKSTSFELPLLLIPPPARQAGWASFSHTDSPTQQRRNGWTDGSSISRGGLATGALRRVGMSETTWWETAWRLVRANPGRHTSASRMITFQFFHFTGSPSGDTFESSSKPHYSVKIFV